MIYFLYGLISITLWFWGKVLKQVTGDRRQGTGDKPQGKIFSCILYPVSRYLIDLSSIFEDAQFVGFREAKRRSSWNRT